MAEKEKHGSIHLSEVTMVPPALSEDWVYEFW